MTVKAGCCCDYLAECSSAKDLHRPKITAHQCTLQQKLTYGHSGSGHQVACAPKQIRAHLLVSGANARTTAAAPAADGKYERTTIDAGSGGPNSPTVLEEAIFRILAIRICPQRVASDMKVWRMAFSGGRARCYQPEKDRTLPWCSAVLLQGGASAASAAVAGSLAMVIRHSLV